MRILLLSLLRLQIYHCVTLSSVKKYQTEIHAGMHKNSPFWNKKCKNFLGGGHPSPDPTPLGASIFAPTALKLNVTSPEKNPSYGLAVWYGKTRVVWLPDGEKFWRYHSFWHNVQTWRTHRQRHTPHDCWGSTCTASRGRVILRSLVLSEYQRVTDGHATYSSVALLRS